MAWAIKYIGILGILILSSYASVYSAEKKPQAVPEKPQAVAPVADKDKPKVEASYEYTGMNRRDPFTSLILKRGAERDKRATALETYDVAEMKIIAILTEKKKTYAVISLPDNKSYTVSEGIKVGTNYGVIKKITKDSVVIAEKYKDAWGKTSTKEKVLKLRVEEE